MPDTGDAAVAAKSEDMQGTSHSCWRRVLFGAEANKGVPFNPKAVGFSALHDDWIRSVAVPLLVALIAVFGSTLVFVRTTADSDQEVAAERERITQQFRLDQRQARYDEIRQQLTRLENASDFSKSAASAGIGLGYVSSGLLDGFADLREPITQLDQAAKFGGRGDSLAGNLGGQQFGAVGSGPLYQIGGSVVDKGAVRSTWQDAYTGLDQAISNAEIASSKEVINLARALRDKHRMDYFQAVLRNIDTYIDSYPDPKPDKLKLAAALVGVPVETGPRSYDAELLTKSTDELTAMYVRAAKDDLELDDR